MFTNKFSLRQRVMEAVEKLIVKSQELLDQDLALLEQEYEANKESTVMKYVHRIVAKFEN